MLRRLEAGDDDAVLAAAHLFDTAVDPGATRRFLADPTHHLLVAYDADRPVGFVSGAELTHPDKGTELFLNELEVEEAHRRRGIGRALVAALAALGEARGCVSMWVGTEPDNTAARATYASAKGSDAGPFVMYEWDLTGAGNPAPDDEPPLSAPPA